MSFAQISLIAVLAAALALFIWGRWRYDVVAVLALVATLLLGIVEPRQAFIGFSDPAVITVALVLILSAAIRSSGILQRLIRHLEPILERPNLQVLVFVALVIVLSGLHQQRGRARDFAPRRHLFGREDRALAGNTVDAAVVRLAVGRPHHPDRNAAQSAHFLAAPRHRRRALLHVRLRAGWRGRCARRARLPHLRLAVPACGPARCACAREALPYRGLCDRSAGEGGFATDRQDGPRSGEARG